MVEVDQADNQHGLWWWEADFPAIASSLADCAALEYMQGQSTCIALADLGLPSPKGAIIVIRSPDLAWSRDEKVGPTDATSRRLLCRV